MIGHVLVNTDEVVTSEFVSTHMAIDLVGAENSISDVISLADGVVELVVSDVKETNRNSRGTASYGNFVKIRHSNGQKTLYAHLKYGSVKVKKGDTVSKGEIIGTMGATGNAYGVHLHFEVRNQDESRENPYEYLWGHKQIRTPIEKVSISEKPNEEPLKEDVSMKKVNVYEDKREVVKETKVKEESYSEEVKNDDQNKYLKNDDYKWYSIVDALKEIGVDSSYYYRNKLALANGINDYKGTTNQNLKLLKLLKLGKLLSV